MTDVTLDYAYGNGRLSAMTRTANGLGQTYNMAYDGFGKLTSVKVGTRSLAGYTYAANDGLLTQMTYGNGNTVAYDYDDLERVKNIYYNNSNSPACTYTYKGEGTLGQLTDNTNNRTYAYTYDSLGRLNGLTEQFGGASVQTFSASYDTANRPTNVTYAVSPSWNGTFGSYRVYTYTYSASDGLLTSMTGPGASMAYTYDGLKRLMKRVVSSDSSEVITRNYSYLAGSGSNTSPLVSSLTANHGSTNLFSGNYSYDSVGNITAITGSAPASYTYDSQNQLLTEVRGGTTYTYTYDAAGNLLSRTKLSGSGTDSFTYGNTEWRDLLTAYNGNSITYDTVGNPTTWYDGATMTWVNGKRLASISATNSHSALAFTYDVDGLRLTKTVGTGSSAVEHKYTWQGGKLIAEYDGTNTLEFFYDESGAPYAFSCNGTTYYYVTNLQGDVVKIVDASGTSQAEYSYNAWGQVISTSGTLAKINPIRYRGYYYDSETGFYYLKSRYYDPEICRFINADCIISNVQGFIGCNVSAYCNNNPVNGIDPSGRFSFRSLWREAESACWHAISCGLEKAGYKLTASLLNQAADGTNLTYTSGNGSYASELCRSDKGIQESITKALLDVEPDITGHVKASWPYEIPLTNGDLGAALHNISINFDGIPKGNSLLATVTIVDTFDFTQLKNPLAQGSVIKDLLWLANDIAYFDSKWGLLDSVSVSISFEEEYYYVIPIL